MKKLLYTLTLMSITLIGLCQKGLVAHWKFDQVNDYQLEDNSENANFGILRGGGKITNGIVGNALLLDGINDFVEISEGVFNELSNLSTGSISLWFKVDHIPLDNGIAPIFYYGSAEKCDFFDAANQGVIIEVGHSPVHHESRNLYFTMWKNGCTFPSFCFDSNVPIELGKWYHFVAVVGEDYNTGYLDGKEMINRWYNFGSNLSSQFFDDALAHEKLWIGKGHWDRTEQYFKGSIDDIRIFKTVLTDNEVISLFGKGSVVGLDNNSTWLDEIKIFPNPANDKLFVSIPEENILVNIRLYDSLGKTLSTNYFEGGNSISTSDLTGGVYFVEINTEKGVLRKKIVIMR